MSKRRSRPNVNNVVIKPVDSISPQMWREVQDLFTATYDHRTCRVPYSMTQHFRLAMAYDGDRMIGFVQILDFDSMFQDPVLTNGSRDVDPDPHPLWHPQRPRTLNRRQISICWVHHRYRGQGIATRLYRYAIEQMGATHIHICENRVVDRIDYWRELGFVKCSLYSISQPEPSLRLHLDASADDLWDLNFFNIMVMFRNRDMTPQIQGTESYRSIFAREQSRG